MPVAPIQPVIGDLFPEDLPHGVGPRGNVYVGTCSWSDPSLIKAKTFYPRGFGTAERRLKYYASIFPVVEVDSSYFAIPSPVNAALWAERTPPGFMFNVKAFRLFTGHQTPPEAFPPDIQPLLPPLTGRRRNHYYEDLPPVIQDEMWRRFIDALVPLQAAGKLKAVHFQFAPWVQLVPDRIAHIEECIDRMRGHLVAVEFRNRTWLADDRVGRTLDWLRGLPAVHVVVDEPQGVGNYAQGVWELTHPDLAIVRLHGRNAETWNAKGLGASSERFNYEYSDPELLGLAQRIDALAHLAFMVVVLVNVNFEDQGIRAARKLMMLLAELAPDKVFRQSASGLDPA